MGKRSPLLQRVPSVAGLLLWVFVAVVASQVIVGAILYRIVGAELYSSAGWMTAYTALSYVLTCGLVIFLPTKLKKSQFATNREELGLAGFPRWRDVGLAVGGFFIYFVLAALLTAVFAFVFAWFDPHQVQEIGYAGLANVGERLMAVFALVVVAPVAEELIFRGWLYAKLRARLPIWIAVLLVSALFGLVHGTWNVGINVFAMSVVMCLVRELTGTVWGSIILHVLKNAVAVFCLILFGNL